VLRPGGIFAGRDSRISPRFRMLHVFDTMVVVDPATFPDRLRRAGVDQVRLDTTGKAFRVRAVEPVLEGEEGEASRSQEVKKSRSQEVKKSRSQEVKKSTRESRTDRFLNSRLLDSLTSWLLRRV